MSDRWRNAVSRIAAPLIVGILMLAAWQMLVTAYGIPPYILPGPLLVAETLWRDGPVDPKVHPGAIRLA